MDTRFLQSFLAVVDCGSVAEAARRQNMTAATIKQRVAVLEAEIGSKLLIRSGRVVRPTEAGVAILDRARSILHGVRDLTSVAASESLSGELRLFAIQTALSGLVPDILRQLSIDHPQLDVRLIRGNSIEAYQHVFTGEVDAAIT